MQRYLIIYRHSIIIGHDSVATEKELLELVQKFQDNNSLNDVELERRIKLFDLESRYNSALMLKSVSVKITRWEISRPSLERS